MESKKEIEFDILALETKLYKLIRFREVYHTSSSNWEENNIRQEINRLKTELHLLKDS
jgi:hypothetical protein